MDRLGSKLLEVVGAILPLVLAVVILQFTVIHMPMTVFYQFLIGAVMVITGMVLFLAGVDIGILPMGKALGSELPQMGSLWWVIGIAFLLGFTATIAEPDVIVLTGQVNDVSGGSISDTALVIIIAAGVAFFVAAGLLRTLLNIPIAYLLMGGYIIVGILAFFTPANFLPVAFDAGGVTTGPMTVPVILALGIGFSSVLSGRSAMSDGFGLIGLASIGPIIGVMIMGMVTA